RTIFYRPGVPVLPVFLFAPLSRVGRSISMVAVRPPTYPVIVAGRPGRRACRGWNPERAIHGGTHASSLLESGSPGGGPGQCRLAGPHDPRGPGPVQGVPALPAVALRSRAAAARRHPAAARHAARPVAQGDAQGRPAAQGGPAAPAAARP